MIPELSHLQYLALSILAEVPAAMSHTELRHAFLERGAGNRSGPAFYQFMDRLAESRYVAVTKTKGDSDRQECFYKLSNSGRRAMIASRAFYEENSND